MKGNGRMLNFVNIHRQSAFRLWGTQTSSRCLLFRSSTNLNKWKWSFGFEEKTKLNFESNQNTTCALIYSSFTSGRKTKPPTFVLRRTEWKRGSCCFCQIVVRLLRCDADERKSLWHHKRSPPSSWWRAPYGMNRTSNDHLCLSPLWLRAICFLNHSP